MKKTPYTHSRSGIFLMEIIIAILFFSIVSAICLNIFVHTHNLSKSTAELNFAVREAANMAEIVKSADNLADAKQLLVSVGGCEVESDTENNGSADGTNVLNTYIAYYNADYQPCGQDEAVYYLLVNIEDSSLNATTENESGLINWHIQVVTSSNLTVIYKLTSEVYYAE